MFGGVRSGEGEEWYEEKGKVRKSLGAESEELKVNKAREDEKRAGLEDSLKGLEERLDKIAPVNRALGLGRMPTIASRIVRALDKEGVLLPLLLSSSPTRHPITS